MFEPRDVRGKWAVARWQQWSYSAILYSWRLSIFITLRLSFQFIAVDFLFFFEGR